MQAKGHLMLLKLVEVHGWETAERVTQHSLGLASHWAPDRAFGVPHQLRAHTPLCRLTAPAGRGPVGTKATCSGYAPFSSRLFSALWLRGLAQGASLQLAVDLFLGRKGQEAAADKKSWARIPWGEGAQIWSLGVRWATPRYPALQ